MAQRTKVPKGVLQEAWRRSMAFAVSLALVLSSTPLPAFADSEVQDETVPVEEVQEAPQEQIDASAQVDEAAEQSDQTAVPAEAEETPSQTQDDSSHEPALEAASSEDRGDPVSISFVLGHKRTLIKEVTGDWADYIIDYDNYEAEEFFEYRMSIEEGDKLIVTYESGEVVTYTASETDLEGAYLAFIESEYNISESNVLYIDDFTITSDQYENHWDVGAHQFVIVWNKWDLRTTIDVEVVEDTLASISYEPASPIVYTEGLNGYQNTWSEDEPFFCYNEPKFEPGSVLTLTYNDGSSVRYVCEETDSYRTCFVNESDPTDIIMQGNSKMQVGTYGDQFSEPSSDSVWKLGAHNVWTIAYRGHTYDVPVELVANSLESISYTPVQPIELFEGAAGYTSSSYSHAVDDWVECWKYWYDYREGDVLTLFYSADDSSPEGESHDYVYTLDTPKGDCFVWSDGDQSSYIVPPSMIDVREEEYDFDADLWQSIEIDDDSFMELNYRGRTVQIPVTLHPRTMVSAAVSLADSTYVMGSRIAESGINSGYNVPMLDEDDEITVTYRDDLGNESVVTYVDANGTGDFSSATNSYDWLPEYTIYGEGYDENLDWTGEHWIVGEENYWYLSMNDIVAKVAVNVLSSGVSAIEYIPVEPLKYDLQENGWWREYEDEYGNWDGQFFVYTFEARDGDQLKLTDDDGNTVTYTLVDYDDDDDEYPRFVAEGHEDIDYFDVRTSYGYDEPHDEWQAGRHAFIVSYKGCHCQVPVIIGDVPDDPDPVDLSEAGASVTVQDQSYTGEPLTPEVVVTLDGKDLIAGTDYELSYADNTEAGTATVTVTGMGNYCGERRETFEISPRSLGGEMDVSITYNGSYSGEPQAPSLTIINNFTKKTLVLGEDYELVYPDGEPLAAGDYRFDVVGKGNYTGSLADYLTGEEYLTFTIDPADLSDPKRVIEADIPAQIWTGQPLEPAFDVLVDGHTLTKDTDYTVEYENNTRVGNGRAVITGIGNYKGSYTFSFRIRELDVVAISYEIGGYRPLVEGIDGGWNSPEDDGFFAYHYYSYCPGDTLTVTYEDGSSKVFVAPEDDPSILKSEDGETITRSEIKVSDDQLLEHWGVGVHYCTVSYKNVETTVPIQIIENPVESISYQATVMPKFVEGIGGEDYVDGNGNSFYRYELDDPSPGDVLTVTYNDGRGSVNYVCERDADWNLIFVSEGDPGDTLTWNGWKWSYSVSDSSNQTYDHPWVVGGDNVWTIEYLGHTYDVPVKVVADEYPDAVAKNMCGNCIWVMDATGHVDIVPIEGTNGSLSDNSIGAFWQGHKDEVTSVTVGEGVAAGRSIYGLFEYMPKLRELDIRNLDTSRTVDMERLFCGSEIETLDLSALDTSHVTRMDDMFSYCDNLRSVTLGEKFSFTGAGTERLCSLPEGLWEAASDGTFYSGESVPTNKADTYTRENWEETGSCWWLIDDAGKLTIRPKDGVSGAMGSYHNWDVDAITEVEFIGTVEAPKDSSCLFARASHLVSINLENLDTSNVTDMSSMFERCHSLVSLDLSKLDFSKVTSTDSMCYDCKALESVSLQNIDTPALTSARFMFQGCEALESVDFTGSHAPALSDIKEMFENCTKLESVKLGGLVGASMSIMDHVFDGCAALTSVDAENWDMSNSSSTTYLFNGCKSLSTVDVSKWDVSKVVSTNSMFSGCSALKSIDVSGWQMDSLNNATAMFKGCMALEELDFSGSKAASLMNIFSMFEDCSSLKSLDLRGFDTSKVFNMRHMFYGCTALETLDISTWDTSSVIPRSSADMFKSNDSLKCISVGDKYVIGGNLNSFPTSPSASGKWWSEKEQQWLSWSQIYPSRSRTADTYRSVVDPLYDLGEATLEVIPDQMYTGNGITPKPKVLIDGKEINPPESLLYSYDSNVDVGVATVTVKGQNFCQGMLTATFNIVPVDLSSADVTLSFWTTTYTGVAKQPQPTVRVGDSALDRSTYDWSYDSNINVGTAQVTIKPLDDRCVGTKTVNFQITPATINDVSMTIDKTSFVYTGKAQLPTVHTSGLDAYQKDVDYELIYSNAASTNVGSYTVTLRGKGNYTGTYGSATYTITKANNPMKVKASKATVTVKYEKVKSKAQTLKNNVKFTVKGRGAIKYANASSGKVKKWKVNAKTGKITVPKKTKKGTYKIKIKVTAAGDGNYAASTKYVSYKIKVK